MEFPNQLQANDMRFVLIESNEKKPIGLEWNSPTGKNYTLSEIQNELTKDPTKNYGFLCGHGNYLVVDIDRHSEETYIALTEKIKYLPKTFVVLTRSMGLHFYYKIKDPQNAKFVNLKHNGKDAGEIRWLSNKKTYTQVLCVGSKINGKEYKTLIDNPIAEVEFNEVFSLLSPFAQEVQQKITQSSSGESTINIQLSEIYDYSKLQQYGQEYYGEHPIHGSDSGKNFWINKEKNTWYCFRHNIGGSAIQLYAILNNFCTCETLGELKGKKFIDCVKSLEMKLNRKLLKENDLLNKIHKVMSMELISADIVKELGIYYDANCLWWKWNSEELKYELADDIEIMNTIDKAVKFDKSTLESSVKNMILEGLKREGRKNKPKELSYKFIQFKSKIINIETGEQLLASPDYFVTNPIPWDIGETDETPVIDKLMQDWCGEQKETLYEIIAFSMCPDYFINRILCLTGGGCNGKSTFLTLLRKIIGNNNTTSSELDFLISNRFESSKLYRKLVCFMGETNFATIKNTSLLKKLSGKDLVPCEFKGKNSFDFINYGKIIIATNTLPETMDKTEGFYRRWLIIDFKNKFEEDGRLLEKIPEYEFNNLVKKCVDKLKLLFVNNKFSLDGSIEDRKKAYEAHSNPLKDFIKENYIISPNLSVPYYEVFERYSNFLNSKGLRNVTKKELSHMLDEIGYESERRTYTKSDGKESSMFYIIGIGDGTKVA